MTAEQLAANLVGAEGHPGGAAHLLLLAVLALVALVVVAVNRANRRRARHDTAQNEHEAHARDLSLRDKQPADQSGEPAQETDDAPRDEVSGG